MNDLLNIDDEIEIIYNKSKYLYKLIDIYEVEKTGSITLHNINNITCYIYHEYIRYTRYV